MSSKIENYTKVSCIYIDGHKTELFSKIYMEPFLEIMSSIGYPAKYTNYWINSEDKSRSPSVNATRNRITQNGNEDLDYVAFYSRGIENKLNYSQSLSVLSWHNNDINSSTFFFSLLKIDILSEEIDFIFDTEFKAVYIYSDYAERCPNCYKIGASFQNGNDINTDKFKSKVRISNWYEKKRNNNYDTIKQVRDIFDVNIWSKEIYEYFISYSKVKKIIWNPTYGQIKEHKNYYVWTITPENWHEIVEVFDEHGLCVSSSS